MDVDLLIELARYQAWADREHWKTLRESPALLDDTEIRSRLNHMVLACERLRTLALGETPDPAAVKDRESMDELETAMGNANAALAAAVASVDPDKTIALPRGPRGPFEAPAGVLLLQALTHGQHHRGQNAARMREAGVKPPATDLLMWHALGRP